MRRKQGNHHTNGISRRHVFRSTSAAIAVGGAAMLAPAIMRRAHSQGTGPASLDTVDVAMAIGSVELLWAVLKARKVDVKHGIDAKVSFLAANAVNNGLRIGQYQLGASQPITAAMVNNNGTDITIFAPTLWNNMVGLVPESSTVTSLKDLVGKKISLLPALSGVYTSSQVIAAEMGLDFEKQFQVVTGPPPAVSAFLQRGDVDAAMQIEPLASSLLITKKYKAFMEGNQTWKQLTGGDLLLGAMAAEQKWLDGHRDIAKRLTAAILESGQIIRSDPSVFDEFAAKLRLKTPEQIEFAKTRLAKFYPTEWTNDSVKNVERVIDRAQALGIIKRPKRDFVVLL